MGIFNDTRNILALNLGFEFTSIYIYIFLYIVCMYIMSYISCVAAEHIFHLGNTTKEDAKAGEHCPQPFSSSVGYILKKFVLFTHHIY